MVVVVVVVVCFDGGGSFLLAPLVGARVRSRFQQNLYMRHLSFRQAELLQKEARDAASTRESLLATMTPAIPERWARIGLCAASST